MGKLSQGAFGNFSNKVGNLVGRVRYGENILAIYQPKVANPNTMEQRVQRNKFAIALKGARVVMAATRQFFSAKKKGQTYFNGVMSEIMGGAITGSYPNERIFMEKLPMSNGSVANVYNPQTAYEEGALQFMWTDNSGIGNADMNDNVYVSAVLGDGTNTPNDNPNEMMFQLAGPRNSRTGSLALPADWADKYVHVYIWTARGNEGSPTDYLGCVQLHEA